MIKLEIMDHLIVEITGYVCTDFPGYIHFKIIDIFGKTHHFNEKTPVVSLEIIDENSVFPMHGSIAGKIIDTDNDEIKFSTEKPYGIATEDNINEFWVKKNQVVTLDINLLSTIHKLVTNIKNNSFDHDCLLNECREVLIEYKNNNGNQQIAHNTLMELYRSNEKADEKVVDFVGDLLDINSGYYVGKNIDWR